MDYNNPNDLWLTSGYDPYKGMTEEERIKAGCFQIVAFIAMIFVGLILCALLGSCTTTKYVPVIEHHTDTVMVNTVHKDSVYLHDSISVLQKGDTVTIHEWHTKYKLKEVHDTTYVAKHDTIPQPYPVEKIVPAELTWWQQTRLHLANILLWAALLVLIIYIAKRLLNHKLTRL